MKILKRIFLIILIGCIGLQFIGCQRKKPENPEEVINIIKEMSNYTTNIDIQIINGKQTLNLKGEQSCNEDKVSKLKLDNSREFLYEKGNIYVSDLKNKRKYITDESFDSLYKMSFIEEYKKLLYTNENIKYSYKSINGTEYLVIKLDIPYMNRNLSKAYMYVNYKKAKPYKVIIYDVKNNEKVSITYKNFDSME